MLIIETWFQGNDKSFYGYLGIANRTLGAPTFCDAAKTKELMDALVTKGEYTLAGADKDILDLFAAGFAARMKQLLIKRVYDENKYIRSADWLPQLFTGICSKTDDTPLQLSLQLAI